MKNYFEYPFNEKIKIELINYYNNPKLGQHSKQKDKMNLKLSRIKKMIKLFLTDDVLDVGCSRGDLLKGIEQFINSGVGIDISKVIIKINEGEKHENLSFYSFNGENFPDLQKKFDKIFLIDVLEHSFYPDKLVSEIYNYLKSSGSLIIEVPFSGWLSELLTKKYHQGHLRYYDSKYLVNYFNRHGFYVEKIKVYNSVPFAGIFLKVRFIWSLINILINLIPSRIYPYFGEIILICKKYDKKTFS